MTWGREDDHIDVLFALACSESNIPHVPSFHGIRAIAAFERHANDPLLAEVSRTLIPKLRSVCEERLASHLRPSAFVIAPSIPLTANGKLDRSALAKGARGAIAAAAARQRSHNNGGGGSTYASALTPLQSRLRTLWANALGVDESSIDLDDSFFHLGGNSITSMRVVSAALSLGIELSVRDFFTAPTLRALAATPNALAAVPTLHAPIRRVLFEITADTNGNQAAPFALFGIQRAYWVGQQIGDPASGMGSLNPHIYSEYTLPSSCSPELLGLAIDALVLRHPMLRAIVTPDGMLSVLPPSEAPPYTVQTIPSDTVDATRASMLLHGPRTDRFPLFDVRLSNSGDGMIIHASISSFLWTASPSSS